MYESVCVKIMGKMTMNEDLCGNNNICAVARHCYRELRQTPLQTAKTFLWRTQCRSCGNCKELLCCEELSFKGVNL